MDEKRKRPADAENMRELVRGNPYGLAGHLPLHRGGLEGPEDGGQLHPIEGTEEGLPVELTDETLVRKAEELLQKYKQGKQQLEKRIIEDETWYRQRHNAAASNNPGDPAPSSAWLFNALANKHADAMDNMPSLAVLPREESDKESANTLSDVLPVVLEQNEFEQVYSDMWWYKLRSGTGCTGVFWDTSKLNGLGDISVRSLDLLNLYWEPGITDIQKSRNVFYVSLHDGDQLRQQYPQLREVTEGKSFSGSGIITVAEYVHDESIDKSNQLMMVDWYYKRMQNGKTVLHFCKICAGKVLFCSEREDGYENGFYEHGKYPYVLDALFPVPESPAGFGYIDICKGAQLYIDKLDSALLKNTIMGAKPRFWLKNDGNVNVEEYANTENDFVHFTGSANPNDSVVQIPVTQLNAYAVTMRGEKIQELKEVSGNRDFSQGATTGGVTAFSAIQALKEAGSKLSRDMIASAYRAFAQVGYLCLDLMRQFYTEERTFRITGKRGEMQFAKFSGRSIAPQTVGDGMTGMTQRLPVFDIRVVAQKSDPFNTAIQNERAQALYQMGFFRPDMADQALMTLDMMEFEGIDRVKAKISEQKTMMEKMQQLGQLALTMAAQLDADAGMVRFAPQVQMLLQQQGMMAQPPMMAMPQGGGKA
ncbi:MAG: hypothetical protein E7319_02225 [Clostridiales bacterium]|nr:hypothetical protein [Clostridiales bacterium]